MIARVLSVVLPLLFVATSASHAVDPDYCLDQDSKRYAKQSFVLRAQPSAEADSIAKVWRGSSLSIGTCEDSWCSASITIQGELLKGYAPESMLSVVSPTSTPQPTARTCCKICRKGKACGDSCISRSKTCHKGAGCACNG